MIEKMKFLSITGPKDDIDRVAETYLSRYDIQLEDAMTELHHAQGAAPYTGENPYKKEQQFLSDVVKQFAAVLKAGQAGAAGSGETGASQSDGQGASQKGGECTTQSDGQNALQPGGQNALLSDGQHAASEQTNGTETAHASLTLPETPAQAAALSNALSAQQTPLLSEKAEEKRKLAALQEEYQKILPFVGLNFNLPKILHFEHMKFSFGRMPVEYYQKFMDYVYGDVDCLAKLCTNDHEFAYLVYFVPKREEDRVDAILASMYFEKIFIPDAYVGSPEEEIERLHALIQEKEQKILAIDVKIAQHLEQRSAQIRTAKEILDTYAKNYEIRKYAACTKQDSHSFYILCGWMTERGVKAFRKDIENDANVFCFVEQDVSRLLNGPPTKLRHGVLLRPFELYMDMYGLPAYNEMDPTWLVALTYSVFFGFMFGDLGQGAVLCIGGAILYHFKKMKLAGIISRCGAFSMLFGLLFGSVFGFEDVIHPLWLNPQKAMTTLPFIGKLNTVFIVAIAIGMAMILLCMGLNILNGIRQNNAGRVWLDANGVTGLVFYGGLTAAIILFMTGHRLPGAAVLAVFFVLPLLLLFLKEPILNALSHRELIEGSKGMFVTQGFFELFETLLSYFSNTLSFVRIGAFAVSHAAMMGVVLMLAGAESGGPVNWPVVILGNLFVCGMEGLIVGIQVLRLEYYELFSRFYTGGGRAFRPYRGM